MQNVQISFTSNKSYSKTVYISGTVGENVALKCRRVSDDKFIYYENFTLSSGIHRQMLILIR